MKKNSVIIYCFAFLFSCFILISCSQNYTQFYADNQAPDLAIFSDNANNIMTCYINGHPWRTFDRVSAVFGANGFEINIQRITSQSFQDTLLISWKGNFKDTSHIDLGWISFVLPVTKNFSYKDFNNLQGKRLVLNTANGFFTAYGFINFYNINYILHYSTQGSGSIYFHTAQLDSISPGNYQGMISGIFEANIGSFKISNGRFDHGLDPGELFNFP